MPKYMVVMKYSNGSEETEDEIFDTEAEAESHGQYMCSCYHTGGEVLHLSNPGDYPLDEDDDVDYEVIEVED